jgi:hypothetical protein
MTSPAVLEIAAGRHPGHGDGCPRVQLDRTLATRRMVILRAAFAVVVLSRAGSVVLADRDAVPDGDLLGSDEDVLDEKPEHALAFGGGGGEGVAAQLGEESFQVIGKLEVVDGDELLAPPAPSHFRQRRT